MPWLYGFIYSDPDDERIWVPKRNPWMGWTVNAAHPGGKAILAAALVGGIGAIAATVLSARKR